MRRIEQDLEQIGVSAATATILGRTTSRTINYARISSAQFSREGAFQTDIMLPIIAEVVDVKDLCFFVREHGRKPQHPIPE